VLRRPFVANVGKVASGAAGAQLLTVAFMPVITRLYGPDAFGLLGSFLALTAMVTPVAALGYPFAVVLPGRDDQARALVRLSCLIAFGSSAVFAVPFFLYREELARVLQIQGVESYLILIPFVMISAAILEAGEQWLIRFKKFGRTAKIAVAHSLIVNTAKTGVGLVSPTAAALIALSVLGNFLHAGMLFAGGGRLKRGIDLPNQSMGAVSLRGVAFQYRHFPLYRAPQLLVNAASLALPVLFLASFFGPAAAGFYTVARRVLAMPSRLIGKAVGDVFYPRISEAFHNREDLGALIFGATRGLLIVGVLPFALVFAFGPWIFSVVFGSEWELGGHYARWLAIWLLFGFACRPCVVAIPVLGIQRGFLVYEVLSTCFKLVAILVGAMIFESALASVALYSAIGAIAYLVLMGWVIFVAKGANNSWHQ